MQNFNNIPGLNVWFLWLLQFQILKLCIYLFLPWSQNFIYLTSLLNSWEQIYKFKRCNFVTLHRNGIPRYVIISILYLFDFPATSLNILTLEVKDLSYFNIITIHKYYFYVTHQCGKDSIISNWAQFNKNLDL